MLFETPFVTLPTNLRGRDFCIGDLHGSYAMLTRLLEAVDFNVAKDRLFAVGDLVHRGPSSVECLRLTEKSWFYPVMGNHEAMQLGAYEGAIGSDGRLVVEACEYAGSADPLRPGGKTQEPMMRILKKLPLVFEFSLVDGRRVGIVHAGLPVEWTWDDVRSMTRRDGRLFDKRRGGIQADLLWDRAPMVSAALASLPDIEASLATTYTAKDRYRHALANLPVPGIDLLISGHTTLKSGHPLSTGARVYLDTGAGMRDGRLTILELLSGRYWQVPDPRVDPALPVTEYPSVPRTNAQLAWLTQEELDSILRASDLDAGPIDI